MTYLLKDDLAPQLQAMANAWEPLRGARVFMTGGTGLIGRWLVALFVEANRTHKLGAELVLLTREPYATEKRMAELLADGSVTLHAGDVRHFTPPPGRFTHILHAATESSGGQVVCSRLQMADTIVTGTRRVLEFAQSCGTPRFLYISSAAVYGRSRDAAVPIDEDVSSAPRLSDANLEYDEAKRMAEALCMIYQRECGIPAVIARCFAVVGPHLPLDQHFAIGNFIRDALAGDTIRVSGDGSAVRSYLYLADVARWLWTMLLGAEAGQAYNVGSPEAVTVAALAEQVRAVVNPAAQVHIATKPVEGAPLNYQVPDVRKAGKALGLKPLVSLEEAIRRTAEWAKTAPKQTALPATLPEVLAQPQAVIFDFDGVMTDNRVAVLKSGREAVFCNRSDGLGIGMLRAKNVPMLILSTETNPVVAARAKKLKLECLQGIGQKEKVLAEWLAARGYDPARVIYLGNDINDMGCLKLVGLPVVVGDAYPEVKAVARMVLTKHGGKGAVRELCDRILAAMGSI